MTDRTLETHGSVPAEPRFDVELVAATKRYGETLAVDGISLRIAPASYCCLLGPSGCGKTSTLRMIAGHEQVTDGDVLIRDRNVTDLPPARRGTAGRAGFCGWWKWRILPTACPCNSREVSSSALRSRAR
jgi:ABC-type transport system involved in cytochrome bd biosynthesis fused ATPase/permease subunit